MAEWVEFTAKTVSDALTEASIHFGVPSSMLESQVLSEEKSGFLGLFSKDAKILARIREEKEEASKESIKEVKNVEKKPVTKKAEEKAPAVDTPVVPVKEEKKAEATKEVKVVKEEEVVKAPVHKEPVDLAKVEAAANKFLLDVFRTMDIEATISVSYNEEENMVNINMIGGDMGILIGKRGQTLDSLQYLTSLVINKETTGYLKVKLDTENYRERRKETLENLAKNIAYKVKRSKHSVSLEPMNPYERRIIHSALQADKFVETHSEGEEPYRRVVVTLKKGYKDYNRNNNNRGRYKNNRRDYNNSNYKKNFTEKESTEVNTEE